MRAALLSLLAIASLSTGCVTCEAGDPCRGPEDEIVSIAVTGGTSVATGSTLQLTATATDDDGDESEVTATAAWTTGSAAIATVSGGVVTGVSAGSAVITAEEDGVSGFTTVTVTTGGAFAP